MMPMTSALSQLRVALLIMIMNNWQSGFCFLCLDTRVRVMTLTMTMSEANMKH